MKIAILTSGILPVPAVQGGAVENLVDFYLDYNDRHRLHDITVFSVAHPDVAAHAALRSDCNHYQQIDTTSLWAKGGRWLYKTLHRKEYYNYFIEYFFEQAWQVIRHQQFDCIVLENRPGYAYKLSQRTDTPLVLHLHNDLLNATTPHHQEVFSSLSKILTVSDFIKGRVESILTEVPSQSGKVKTVHNGIDLQRFARGQATTVSRATLGFADDDFVLLFSGRINRDKGVAELIEALLQLRSLPRLRLLVLGSTFFGNAHADDAFVSKLKQQAQPIAERIVFTGFISYGDMPSYLQLADVAVIPSVWDDPFPTTVLEALAMQLPIITTQRGGIPEEVDEKCALQVPADEYLPSHLADAIRRLYEQPEQRALMSRQAAERARYFDRDRFARDFFNSITTP